MAHLTSYFAMFLATYFINLIYVSVFYHRGLAHGALVLTPWLRRFVIASGNWVTGIDPKAWVCMHRRHHLYSDTERDPHSPVHVGLFGVAFAQLRGYQRTLASLLVGRQEYLSVVADLDFEVNVLNAKRLWWAPYALHLALAVGIAAASQQPWLGLAFLLGASSHPIEGWLVNALGHAAGYRNFDTPDNSRNNLTVAWLVMGEGLQNNHHERPASANFAVRWWEPDAGYWVCRVLQIFGLLQLARGPHLLESAATLSMTIPAATEGPARALSALEQP
jgi:stearoyl-CoA desaturase (delta-9 desaturase)